MIELEALRLLHPGWRDLVEVAIVGFALYRVMLLFQGTRTLRIVVGLGILLVVYALSWLFKLTMLEYLLGFVFQYGAIALLVVFAPELRSALAHLGEARIGDIFLSMERREVAEEIFEAVERLSRSSIGAIIALERETPLDSFAESGSKLDAKVTADLISTIFTPYSPLHDGAAIIRGDMIIAAGCILPLSQSPIADRSIGTRHRAALGLSEESDALVLVVSEERATVSIAERGRLWRDLSPLEVRGVLAGKSPARDAILVTGAAT